MNQWKVELIGHYPYNFVLTWNEKAINYLTLTD